MPLVRRPCRASWGTIVAARTVSSACSVRSSNMLSDREDTRKPTVPNRNQRHNTKSNLNPPQRIQNRQTMAMHTKPNRTPTNQPFPAGINDISQNRTTPAIRDENHPIPPQTIQNRQTIAMHTKPKRTPKNQPFPAGINDITQNRTTTAMCDQNHPNPPQTIPNRKK